MNKIMIGHNIAELRKKHNMTQLALANILNVSDKTISKWENGQGYPDITHFPKICELFGVTVDYLMYGEKKGIAVAGNIIADIVKDIDTYPKEGMMAYLSDVKCSVGGCVPNVAINLSKIDKNIFISAYGKVGNDDYGRFIISNLVNNRINVDGVVLSNATPTSFCDVMNMPTGERTFFHKKGANMEFSPEDIDMENLNCSIFHIGYILLLDRFDAPDSKYGTVMARFLHDLQKKGIATSIDVVSDSTADYAEKIIPALKYCDFAIMNDMECCKIYDLDASKRGDIKKAMYNMAECGVGSKVIIHSKKISYLLDVKSGEFIECASLKIPKEDIKGSVGAGDAFCAGCLYGIYSNYDNAKILEFASATAACSLFAQNAVDSMKSKKYIWDMAQKYGRIEK